MCNLVCASVQPDAKEVRSGCTPLYLCHLLDNEKDLKNQVFKIDGGDKGSRTPDLLNAIQALYQLSYTPEVPS